MKEPLIEKLKKWLHGTFLFPHNLRKTEDGIIWCTCGYKK